MFCGALTFSVVYLYTVISNLFNIKLFVCVGRKKEMTEVINVQESHKHLEWHEGM